MIGSEVSPAWLRYELPKLWIEAIVAIPCLYTKLRANVYKNS